jgi:hypothetical protein
VILYSGYAEGISEAQLAASGVRLLMRKPIEPADLRANLAELLGAAPAPVTAAAARKATASKPAAKTPRKAASGKMRRRRATPVAQTRAGARRSR